jgi:hypothetical protein
VRRGDEQLEQALPRAVVDIAAQKGVAEREGVVVAALRQPSHEKPGGRGRVTPRPLAHQGHEPVGARRIAR